MAFTVGRSVATNARLQAKAQVGELEEEQKLEKKNKLAVVHYFASFGAGRSGGRTE